MPFIIGKDKLAGAGGAAGAEAAIRIVDVDTPNFEQVVVHGSKKVPVLLDIWAPWCEPCKSLGPTLEKIAREYAGAFVLAKMDVDRNPEVAQLLGVRSVPTVVLFKAGRPVDGFMGALPESQVKAFLSRHVSPRKAQPAPAEGESPAALLGEGRVAEAMELLNKLPDPVLQLRALVLAADPAASGAIEKLTPEQAAEAHDTVEAAKRLVAAIAENGPGVAALRRGDLSSALDTLLEAGTEPCRQMLRDLLLLMGRGEFADGYRTRLARQLFS